MQQPNYHFLDLTPASQRHLFTKICEFDIACNKFAKLTRKDICEVRRDLLTEAYLITFQQKGLAIALSFTVQKEFNFAEVPTETQKFIYFRLQAAETAKDWVLTFRSNRIRDIQAIEAEAKSYTESAPDEEIAAFFQERNYCPSFLALYKTLAEEAAIS